MATCIEDTVETTGAEEGWHHHGILGSHCTAEFLKIRFERGGLNVCHLNFPQAIEPFGSTEENISDNL